MRKNNRQGSRSREPQLLEIEKFSHEGRGIAHHEGKVVFVDGALQGELVHAAFTRSKGNFAEARITEIIQASADRVTPVCPWFEQCGGCSLQHFASQAQLAFKEQVLHERLEHAIGLSTYEKLQAISGPATGYRRKARLGVRYVAKRQKALVGFRERYSSFITDMDACAVLDSRVSSLLPQLSSLITCMHSAQYVPQVEVAIGDDMPDSNSCALVIRHLQILDEHDLQLLLAFGTEHAVDIYLQPQGPDSVHRIWPTASADRLYYNLPDFNLRMAFHPADFTQVNADINRQMLQRALELLELNAGDKVLDLFCGLGNFTLPMATRASHVTGVEGSAAMVDRGQENADRNNITNVSFICANLSLPPEQHPWLQTGFDKVLLDPPRSGAQEVLPAIIAARPQRIVYVSCNPATLARDAALLNAQGYRLHAAGAMDMFPHTGHVEAIALFMPAAKRKKA